jgi:hypothetical protein
MECFFGIDYPLDKDSLSMASIKLTFYHILVHLQIASYPLMPLIVQITLISESMDKDRSNGMANPEVLQGLRVLARIIAAAYLAQTDAQAERPSDGEEVDDDHS